MPDYLLNGRCVAVLFAFAVSLAGCATTPGINTKPAPIATKTHVIGRWRKTLDMEIMVVANRTGGTLAAGDTGWCIVSLLNISDRPMDFHTIVFSGIASPEQIPSAVSFTGYHGLGIASLAVKWVGDGATGQWQSLAPPDGTVSLPPGHATAMARLIKAPKTPGVYNLHVRLDNTDAVRADETCGNPSPTFPGGVVRLEAITTVIITKR